MFPGDLHFPCKKLVFSLITAALSPAEDYSICVLWFCLSAKIHLSSEQAENPKKMKGHLLVSLLRGGLVHLFSPNGSNKRAAFIL